MWSKFYIYRRETPDSRYAYIHRHQIHYLVENVGDQTLGITTFKQYAVCILDEGCNPYKEMCLNGGTCASIAKYVSACVCPPGLGGTRCEMSKLPIIITQCAWK